MHTDHLIRMANQIGAFFEAMPDRPEALEGAARHIRSFWEPRMRQAMLAYLDGHREEAVAGTAHGQGHRHGDDDDQPAQAPRELSPFIAEALAAHRGIMA